AAEQHRAHHHREDLTGERLLLGVEEEAPPALSLHRRARPDQPIAAELLVEPELLGLGRVEEDERLRDAMLAIELAVVAQGAVHRVEGVDVARVVAIATMELLRILDRGAGRDAGEVDVDGHMRAGLLELSLELGDLRKERLDAALVGLQAGIVRWT